MVEVESLRVWACGAGAAAALLCAAGCANLFAPSPVPMTQPGTLGMLDTAYDRTKWRWVRNPDGRPLLTHVELQKCFVDPDPADDFTEPGFVVKREQKTIGKTHYEVQNVFEGREFWMAVYQPAGSKDPWLGVYSDGRCREEAERILQAYEKQ
jgi:hypothetical protein